MKITSDLIALEQNGKAAIVDSAMVVLTATSFDGDRVCWFKLYGLEPDSDEPSIMTTQIKLVSGEIVNKILKPVRIPVTHVYWEIYDSGGYISEIESVKLFVSHESEIRKEAEATTPTYNSAGVVYNTPNYT